jgi:uncharacterized protein YndB with AHSA1/START domain
VTTPSDREIVFTRVFNAPRPLVFKAWSDPKLLEQWWGPKDWTLPVNKLDFRPGGSWHYCMKGPDGMESWGKAVYHEIVAPERIIYTDYFSTPEGTPVEGMPEATVTVEFIEQDGKTLLKNTAVYQSAEARDKVLAMGIQEGVNETFARLDALLASA